MLYKLVALVTAVVVQCVFSEPSGNISSCLLIVIVRCQMIDLIFIHQSVPADDIVWNTSRMFDATAIIVLLPLQPYYYCWIGCCSHSCVSAVFTAYSIDRVVRGLGDDCIMWGKTNNPYCNLKANYFHTCFVIKMIITLARASECSIYRRWSCWKTSKTFLKAKNPWISEYWKFWLEMAKNIG